ncbi:MAG: four helix bundle protein [bacterium]|nr:four helix bundle protein [bacterium]
MKGEKIKSYKELFIWQKGIDLVKDIYKLTKKFPESERYALIDQIHRSAISIPSNIAEGQARQHSKEFRQFLYITLGSLAELDTQLTISMELKYISEPDLNQLSIKIITLRKMINGLLAKLTTSHLM